jgi:circadian clock protein KaiC
MDNNANDWMNKGNDDRIKTWVVGLDDKIQGGIPRESTVLISGKPGCGKSILLMHIIANNIIHNHMKCIFISVEQPRKDIIRQAWQFGWDFEKMEQEGNLYIIALNSPELLELQQVRDIKQLLQKNHYDIAAMDSLSAFSQMPTSTSTLLNSAERGIQLMTFEELRRINSIVLLDTMKQEGITSFFTSHKSEDIPDDSKNNICDYRADCLIDLNAEKLGETMTRTLQVVKLRQTKIDCLPYDFDFTKDGITLIPEA